MNQAGNLRQRWAVLGIISREHAAMHIDVQSKQCSWYCQLPDSSSDRCLLCVLLCCAGVAG
jgi:hypothetical protein